MEEINVLCRFPNIEMTTREYLKFSKNILSQLKIFSDDYKTFYAWGSEAKAGMYLKEDLSDFESVVFNQLRSDELAFINPEKSNKDLTLDSKCHINFGNTYSINKNHKDKIDITISAGSINKNEVGLLNFEFSNSLQPYLYFTDLLSLLEFSIELINPFYATISSFEFRKKVSLKDDQIKIGWITYFSNKNVAEILPKWVNKKVLPNKGVIFWLSNEKVLSTNEEEVLKTTKIRDLLRSKKFLSYNYE